MSYWKDKEDDYQEKLMTRLTKEGVIKKYERRALMIKNVAKVIIIITAIMCVVSVVIGIVM